MVKMISRSRPRPSPTSPSTTPLSRVIPLRTRTSQIRSFVLLLLCFLSSPTLALRILLTNDDGLERPGLQQLRTALINNGHEVYSFAPATDRTGLSASISLSLPFTELRNNQVIVNGPPASCVIAGLSFMEEGLIDSLTADGQPIGTPDLVVVGISDGFPTGPQTLHSSSVGAALTALSRGIPAVTVAGLPPSEEQQAYYEQVADFTARFINQWTSTMNLNDMPTGYGIKIAYPGRSRDEVQGVQLAEHGRDAPISFGYVPSSDNPNIYQISPVTNPNQVDPESESAIVDSGSISVLPISSRFYLLQRDFNVRYILTLRRMIRNLQP